MWTLFKMPFCLSLKKVIWRFVTAWGWLNDGRMFISGNLLTLNSKSPWACRKLSGKPRESEYGQQRRIRVSSDILCGFDWKWRTDLFWKICPNEPVQLKWRSHLFKPCFSRHGHRWPLKRAFEDSCQWSNQNKQNQIILISSNNILNGITVQQIINIILGLEGHPTLIVLQYVYCAQCVNFLYTWNISWYPYKFDIINYSINLHSAFWLDRIVRLFVITLFYWQH